MPFKSKKQETYLKINEPKVYKKWKNDYDEGGVNLQNPFFSKKEKSPVENNNKITDVERPAEKSTTVNFLGEDIKLSDLSDDFGKSYRAEAGKNTINVKNPNYSDASILFERELEIDPDNKIYIDHEQGERGKNKSTITLNPSRNNLSNLLPVKKSNLSAGLATDWKKDDTGYAEGNIDTSLGNIGLNLKTDFMKDETGQIVYKTPKGNLEATGFTDFKDLQSAIIKAKKGDIEVDVDTNFDDKNLKVSYNRGEDDIIKKMIAAFRKKIEKPINKQGWSGEYRTDFKGNEKVEVDYTTGPVKVTGETNFGGDDSRQKITVEVMKGPIDITGETNFDGFESLGVKYSKDNLNLSAKTNFEGKPRVSARYNSNNFNIGADSDLSGNNSIMFNAKIPIGRSRGGTTRRFNNGGMAGCPMDGAIMKGGTKIKPDRYKHGKKKV